MVELLDPGFTNRKGRIMKLLSKDRLLLAKSKMIKEDEKRLVAADMKEVHVATECLKYCTPGNQS